jgi:proteasome lid subunit RPN8/RPN11
MQNNSSAEEEFSVGTRFIAPAYHPVSITVLDQMQAHALSASGEVCGFVYGKHYRALRNIATTPDKNFFADPVDLAHALFLHGEPLAIFHTHTDGNLGLSVVDRNLWYYRNSTMIVGCIYDGRLRWKMYGNRGD